MMKKEKVSYKHFARDALGLVKFNFWPLMIFELLYGFCGSVVIFPAVGFLLRKSLSAAGLFYITGDNIRQLAGHPVLWAVWLFLLLVLAFYTLVEFTTLSVCFHESLAKRKVQALPLMRSGFVRALSIFKPKNFLMILLLIVIIPFMNLLVTSNFIGGISIPGFIQDYIAASGPLSAVFSLLLILLSIVLIRWLFVFNVFAGGNRSFREAHRESARLMKGRFFRTLLHFAIWNLFIAVLSVLVIGVFALISLLPAMMAIDHLQSLSNPSFGFSLMMGGLSAFFILGSTMINTLAAPLNFAFITRLYEAYAKADGLEAGDAALVHNNMPEGIRKKHLVIAACVLMALFIGVKTTQIVLAADGDTAEVLLKGPQVTGHRGNSTEAPENTKSALEAAIACGADYVEIDIAETKDGVLVVSHDNNIKRISGQNLDIWNSNYDAIKDLDVGSWFAPAFSGERLMTLEEAIDTCRGKVKMNIELKPTAHDHDFVEKAVAEVQKQDFKDECVLASLDYPTLERVKAIDPEIRTAYITAIAYGNVDTLPVDAFSIEATFVNQTLVEAVHRQNKEIYVWTVDNEELISSMIDLNVDNIVTDDVPLAKRLVQETAEDSQNVVRKTLERIVLGI